MIIVNIFYRPEEEKQSSKQKHSESTQKSVRRDRSRSKRRYNSVILSYVLKAKSVVLLL